MKKATLISSLFLTACVSRPIAPKTVFSKTPEAIAAGKILYAKSCSTCHGDDGKGQGETSMYLSETVPSFLEPHLKHGNKPEDLFKIISLGVNGSAMKAFDNLYSEEQRWQLTFFVLSLRK